mmetsp:Transcript_6581/g.12152  ORF Transcript_6581/g.12152 Transcript_6581/m.12152 type:complete len:475 (+) Transcript_6581:323-1747(+)
MGMVDIAHSGAEARLSCDSNLVALVCMLFTGGFLLWSSLKTGVQTTRVVVKIARNSGCCDRYVPGTLGKVQGNRPLRRRGPVFPAVVGLLSIWAKSLVSVTIPGTGSSSSSTTASSKSLPSTPKQHSKLHASSPEKKLVSMDPLDESPVESWSAFKLFVLSYCIPYRTMSRIWGVCTRIPLPFYALKWLFYKGWAVTFGCNLDEMRFPLERYSSLSSFFLRPLKDGAREIDMTPGALVSPVDGKVLHAASTPMTSYDDVVLEQVKGLSYTLRDFIGDIPEAFRRRNLKGRKLNTVVLYLSPADYHHFHSPCEASFSERKHFAGALLPVKPSFAHQVDGLYCVNERVVLNGKWSQGFFSYVAVGALNVGSIELACEPSLRTNVMGKRKGCFQRTFEPQVSATRGERLGAFHLGSTVVLVFESDENFEFSVSAGDVVQVGQRIDIPAPATPSSPEEAEPEARPMMCPPWPATVSAK